MLIGVITTECFTEFQSEVMRGIISQSFKSNCDIAVISSMQNFYLKSAHKNTEKNIFELILSDNFDGFIYDRNVFKDENIQNYIDNLCTKSGKPVMLLDHADHNKFETTMVDDIEAFEAVTDHLIDVHGYKKIYCLTGPKDIACSEERLKGYLRSMKNHHINIYKSYYYYGDFWTGASAELAKKISNGTLEKPDAVVCGNDISAIALSERLTNSGFRVPEDIAVAGYDASTEGYRASPSITSYIRPNFQLGAEAFRRLYRIITGKICNKVPNEPGHLRIGKSCGCSENPTLKRNITRRAETEAEFQRKMGFSDMLVDITNTDSIAGVCNRIDHFTYLLYKMSRFYICLTDKFKRSVTDNPKQQLSFNADDYLITVYDKSAIKRNYPDYTLRTSDELIDSIRAEKKQPCAFFLTPLNYNDNFFGYTAVSFGKNPVTYTHLFLQWISYLNIALEKVRINSAMNITVKKLDNLAEYDHITGFLNLSSMKEAYLKKLNNFTKNISTVTFMYIELTDQKKLYLQHGPDVTKDAIARFSSCLKSILSEDNLCIALSRDCFGVIAFNSPQTEDFFNKLKSAVNLSESSKPELNGIPFSIGAYTCNIEKASDDPETMLHKAAVNHIYSYSRSDQQTNPHFEKLCQLRNSLIKNPELSWNISEIADKMFISKSYLQKIYKTTFNKSIIEELIQFRLDKAKELLLNSDATVSEISKVCGYSTYNYFVRQFKTAENMSPSEFRELHKR